MIKNNRTLQSGQSMIEFGLVAIVFILLVLGVFDLGRVVFYYSNLSNAAREGARYGAVHPDDMTGITDTICKYSTGIDLGCPDPSATVCGDALDPAVTCPDPLTSTLTIATQPHAVIDDDYMHIHLTYAFRPVTPLIAAFLSGGKIDLNIESTMRIER